MTYDLVESGLRIKALRIQKGITQEELAEALGISRVSMGRIETGIRGCSVDLLLILIEILDTSMEYIVAGRHPKVNIGTELKGEVAAMIQRLLTLYEKM